MHTHHRQGWRCPSTRSTRRPECGSNTNTACRASDETASRVEEAFHATYWAPAAREERGPEQSAGHGAVWECAGRQSMRPAAASAVHPMYPKHQQNATRLISTAARQPTCL